MSEKCSILCDFCDALQLEGDIGKTISFKNILKGELDSRLIMETDNFAVIAGMGPISEGYLLLLTKKHYLSMAEIDNEMFVELEEIYEKIKNLLHSCYSKTIVFEHGPMAIKDNLFSGYGGGSCMDHAHLHFVPLLDDSFIHEIKKELSYVEISNLSELKKQYEKQVPYLYLQDLQGHLYIFDAPDIESQYMRKKIARHTLKADKWNWRINPNAEELINTVKTLHQCINDEGKAESELQINKG